MSRPDAQGEGERRTRAAFAASAAVHLALLLALGLRIPMPNVAGLRPPVASALVDVEVIAAPPARAPQATDAPPARREVAVASADARRSGSARPRTPAAAGPTPRGVEGQIAETDGVRATDTLGSLIEVAPVDDGVGVPPADQGGGATGTSSADAPPEPSARDAARAALVAALTRPRERCGDPLNGEWHGLTRALTGGFLWIDVTLRLMRRGDAIEGSLIRHEWFHHGDDLVVDPPCTSDMNNFVLRAPLEGRASDGLFALTSRRITRGDIQVYCGEAAGPIERWLPPGGNRLSLRAHGPDELAGRLEHMMSSIPITLHRTGCGDSAADRAE